MSIKLEITVESGDELLAELRRLAHAVSLATAVVNEPVAVVNDVLDIDIADIATEVDIAAEAEAANERAAVSKKARAAADKKKKEAAAAVAKEAKDAAKAKAAEEAADAEMPEPELSKDQVRGALMAFMKRHSEKDTANLLLKHGGGAANVSALDKRFYDSVFRAATADLQ